MPAFTPLCFRICWCAVWWWCGAVRAPSFQAAGTAAAQCRVTPPPPQDLQQKITTSIFAASFRQIGARVSCPVSACTRTSWTRRRRLSLSGRWIHISGATSTRPTTGTMWVVEQCGRSDICGGGVLKGKRGKGEKSAIKWYKVGKEDRQNKRPKSCNSFKIITYGIGVSREGGGVNYMFLLVQTVDM